MWSHRLVLVIEGLQFSSFVQGYSNVTYIDDNSGISELIEEADVVITDISTVFMEAMSIQKPIVLELSSLFLPNEKVTTLEAFATVTTDMEELQCLVNKISSDNSYCWKWMEKVIDKQNNYFRSRQRMSGENYWDYILSDVIDANK